MGDRNLETLSRHPDLAKSIAARTNLLQVYGPGGQDRHLFDVGLRVQGEICDTGTSPEVEDVLELLGQLVTNLPGTLTKEEEVDLRYHAGLLEERIGGFNLLPVVLTWVMREPVRRGEVSLELLKQRPAQPKSFAQTLRDLADTLEGVAPSLPPPGSNITPFRRNRQ